MISGIVPFEEIVQSVKDETGIENMRPLYEKIRRFIFRAEREIGYGGTVDIKKVTYKRASGYNGKYFKFPEDFIEYEGIGIKGNALHPSYYTKTSEGIRFNSLQNENIVLLYWGIKVDNEGNPIVTRNHEKAVVAYILWKMYSSRIFLGIGNFNYFKEYEDFFTVECLAARGDDAMPTTEEWNDLGALSYTDRRILIKERTHSYSYAEEHEEEACEFINGQYQGEGSGFGNGSGSGSGSVSTAKKIYFWQLINISDKIDSVINALSNTYFQDKESKLLSEFEQGLTVDYSKIGSICFAVANTEEKAYLIFDILGNNITNSFDIYYDSTLKVYVFVSKNFQSYSSIFFKFKTP